jgi:hypothetical protein
VFPGPAQIFLGKFAILPARGATAHADRQDITISTGWIFKRVELEKPGEVGVAVVNFIGDITHRFFLIAGVTQAPVQIPHGVNYK